MNKIETRLLKKSVPFRTFPRVLLITKWLIIEYSKHWNFAHQFSIQESQRRKIRREDPARHHESRNRETVCRPEIRSCWKIDSEIRITFTFEFRILISSVVQTCAWRVKMSHHHSRCPAFSNLLLYGGSILSKKFRLFSRMLRIPARFTPAVAA